MTTVLLPPTKQVRPLTIYILRHYPAARESDKRLIWRFYDMILSKHGCALSREQWKVLMNSPTFESVRRTRQKIHEEARLGGEGHIHYDLLPKDKGKARLEREKQWRKWARQNEL